MKKKYDELASNVIKYAGGEKNIKNAWHCVTRLRFNLADKDSVDLESIKKVPGVMGAQFAGDQFQVIIGNDVESAFDAVQKALGNSLTQENTDDDGDNKESVISRLMDFISGTFTPAMPAIIGAGLLKGIVSLIQTFNWLPTNGAEFKVLEMISDSAFYFLPFLLAVSAARKLKTNEFLAMSIAGVLLYPTMVNGFNAMSAGKTVATMKLFGFLPMPYLAYSSSVIPILLAVWFLKYVFQWVKGWMPKSVTIMLSPVLTLLIVVPVTLVILGPLGTYVGTGFSAVILWLFKHVGIIAGALLGGLWPLLVMTGMHWAIMPFGLQIFNSQGFDSFMSPSILAATFAMAGATFAVLLKTKDDNMKQIALPAGISAILGITEPAMYGVTLKLKKPLIGALIGGGVTGAVFNVFHLKAFGMGMPGLIALPGFVEPHNNLNIIVAGAGSILAFAIAFIITWYIGFEDEKNDTVNKESAQNNKNSEKGTQIKISAPVSGQAVPVENLTDPTFAGQVMGQTTAIQPSTNKVVSPFEGEVTLVGETKHAVGIKSVDGIELLIHMGIDTVELQGKHFVSHVKQGDHVIQGDLLMEMDVAAIKEAGYDPVVLSIVTNSADYLDVISTTTSNDIVVGDNVAAAVN